MLILIPGVLAINRYN